MRFKEVKQRYKTKNFSVTALFKKSNDENHDTGKDLSVVDSVEPNNNIGRFVYPFISLSHE